MTLSSPPSMNKELKEWLADTKKFIKEKKNSQQPQRKPSGKCEICGENDAKAICLKCERLVCGSCYFKLINVCKKCVPPETAAKWEGKQPNWEEILGVDWVG